MAMFDYDPSTMSPNPDGCEEELPFQEGDTIKVYLSLACFVFPLTSYIVTSEKKNSIKSNLM